jgi:branched-chain amino acid transport system substrate-binding protein
MNHMGTADGRRGLLWSPAVPYHDPVFVSTAAYVAAYEAKFKTNPTFNSAAATAGAELVGLAIEKAGSAEPDPVRDALRSFKGETLWVRRNSTNAASVFMPARTSSSIRSRTDKTSSWPLKTSRKQPQLPMPGWEGR